MAEYIDKQTFLEGQRHLYCENCAKRKGMKQGKMQFVYEIGDAPCRSCGYGDVLDDLEDFPAADVRHTVKARWTDHRTNEHDGEWYCSACGEEPWWCGVTEDILPPYCPNCGAMMEES